jgi:hypothetical protein
VPNRGYWSTFFHFEISIFSGKIGGIQTHAEPRSQPSPYAGIENIEIAAHSTTEGFKYNAIDE